MSEILNFLALISQLPPYLMFILVSKSTHPVSLVLSSQNAQCFYISAPLYLVEYEKHDFPAPAFVILMPEALFP